MLDGWRNQQLSRNLQFATIEQRLRCVQRFIDQPSLGPATPDGGSQHPRRIIVQP